jgi:hypothetical protein
MLPIALPGKSAGIDHDPHEWFAGSVSSAFLWSENVIVMSRSARRVRSTCGPFGPSATYFQFTTAFTAVTVASGEAPSTGSS